MDETLDLDLPDELGALLDDGDTQVNIPAPAAAKPAKPAKAVVAPPPAPTASLDDPPLGNGVAGMAADIPVQLVAAVGRKQLSLKEILQLQVGQVVDLQQPVSTRVELVANGKLFAKGELVEIDGQLGVRIAQLMR